MISHLMIIVIVLCLMLLGTRLLGAVIREKTRWDRYLLALAWLLLVVIFIIRWNITTRLPLQGLFDTLIIFSWCILTVVLLGGLLYDMRMVNVPAAAGILLIMLYALAYSKSVPSKLPPALQSPWFIPHVLLYFLGYALLAISACASVVRLFSQEGGASTPDKMALSHLDSVVRTALMTGFMLITLGILTGAIWAKYAWGGYWGWDPKEAWALITWLLYLGMLHLMLRRSNLSKGLLIANVGSFLIVLFTYFGVKFLPTAASSIHVY